MASDPLLATSATIELDGELDGVKSSRAGPSDPELIAAYRGGNLAAYGELTRRYQIPLYRLLLGLLGDEDLAEQACEEAFVVANRRLDELADPTRFYRWLLGIAREVSRQFLADPASEEHSVGPAPREQLKHEVRAVLQSLTPDHRLALILVEMREAPPDEVAAALGIDLGEVPEVVAAAREAFGEALAARESGTVVDDTSDNREALGPGSIVDGRYEVDSLLGAGGMGAVYLARALDSGELVALKTMLPSHELSDRSVRRFEREVEAIARLGSERFVKLLDHGETADAVRYLVMEYLEGRSLADCVHDQAPLAPARALAIVADLVEGLGHAHGHGIVHRDLKPDNVMLVHDTRGDERPKILDLGLAKILESETDDISTDLTRLTRQGAVFGTPAYMAPEQALGKEVDGRADLYAVTVILFELLTGRLPFSARNPSALLVKHVSQPPPPLATMAPHLRGAEALQELVEAGLAKQPEARIADARAYLEQVEALARDEQLTRSIPITMDLSPAAEPSAAMYSESPDPKSDPASASSSASGASASRASASAARAEPPRDRVMLGAWLLVVVLGLALAAAIYAIS